MLAWYVIPEIINHNWLKFKEKKTLLVRYIVCVYVCMYSNSKGGQESLKYLFTLKILGVIKYFFKESIEKT